MLGKGGELVVWQCQTFTSSERKEVSARIGRELEMKARASGSNESEIKRTIVTDDELFINEGKEVSECLLGGTSFMGKSGVINTSKCNNSGWERGGLANENSQGLGRHTVLHLDGSVF